MDITGNFGIRPLTELIRTEVDFTKKIDFKTFFQPNFSFVQLMTVDQKVGIRFTQPNRPDLFVPEPKV
jgi:hypothetical protein